MIQRSEGYFRGYNDFELFFQMWKSEDPRGSIIVTHGLGEHSESYDRLASGLLPGPWNMYAWDLRGHGRSEGKRGTVRAFDDFCEDLKLFTEFILKNREEEGPLILLGHSMGGLVLARTLNLKGPMNATALVFSSPLMGIAVKVNKLKEKASRLVAKLAPNLTLNNEIEYDVLTHDPAVIEEYEKDPLRHDRISAQLFMEFMEYCPMSIQRAGEIKLPALVQQAGEDYVVSPKAAKTFYENLGSTNKKLIVYDGDYHETYNEVNRDKTFGDLKEWLSQFL